MKNDGDSDGLVRRSYRVQGRVQGVGFRWWTQRMACSLGIGGWVRNEPDGSVVVHAIGSGGALRKLEEALLSGPVGARVDRRDEITPSGVMAPGEFRIER